MGGDEGVESPERFATLGEMELKGGIASGSIRVPRKNLYPDKDSPNGFSKPDCFRTACETEKQLSLRNR